MKVDDISIFDIVCLKSPTVEDSAEALVGMVLGEAAPNRFRQGISFWVYIPRVRCIVECFPEALSRLKFQDQDLYHRVVWESMLTAQVVDGGLRHGIVLGEHQKNSIEKARVAVKWIDTQNECVSDLVDYLDISLIDSPKLDAIPDIPLPKHLLGHVVLAKAPGIMGVPFFNEGAPSVVLMSDYNTDLKTWFYHLYVFVLEEVMTIKEEDILGTGKWYSTEQLREYHKLSMGSALMSAKRYYDTIDRIKLKKSIW